MPQGPTDAIMEWASPGQKYEQKFGQIAFP